MDHYREKCSGTTLHQSIIKLILLKIKLSKKNQKPGAQPKKQGKNFFNLKSVWKLNAHKNTNLSKLYLGINYR